MYEVCETRDFLMGLVVFSPLSFCLLDFEFIGNYQIHKRANDGEDDDEDGKGGIHED